MTNVYLILSAGFLIGLAVCYFLFVPPLKYEAKRKQIVIDRIQGKVVPLQEEIAKTQAMAVDLRRQLDQEAKARRAIPPDSDAADLDAYRSLTRLVHGDDPTIPVNATTLRTYVNSLGEANELLSKENSRLTEKVRNLSCIEIEHPKL